MAVSLRALERGSTAKAVVGVDGGYEEVVGGIEVLVGSRADFIEGREADVEG